MRWRRQCISGVGRVHREIGEVAGSVNGRSSVQMFYKYYLTYRIVYEMFNGKIPDGMTVDHIDRNCENNRIGNLRLVTKAVNTRNRKKSSANKTGVTGVRLRLNKQGGLVYIATWQGIDNRQHSKSFTWLKYGRDEAFKLACEYRERMIKVLNEHGKQYSDTHGLSSVFERVRNEGSYQKRGSPNENYKA